MRKSLFPSLALQNLRKNGRFYFSYILTIIGTAASFYILTAIATDEGMSKLRGADYVSAMASIGVVIAGLFSVIFLLYTNSFLMKRRKKELGLYNILGMGKRHIACILCFESLYVAVLGIAGGLVFGILFHKLAALGLFYLLRLEVPFGFSISPTAIKACVTLFAAIIGLTLLLNLGRIHVSNPIELLRGSETGEKEPKTKWLLALVGIASLGTAYTIALKTESPVDALAFYFLAVFLVIVGTYCLFTALSIVILKALRKHKNFYYKTQNFIGISGMLYRMKQNAVGLANICILSTMVLVMISGTLSLYIGTEDALENRYPGDVMPQVRFDPEAEEVFEPEAVREQISGVLADKGVSTERFDDYTYLAFTVGRLDGKFTTDRSFRAGAETMQLCFITEKDYETLTGRNPELKDGEVAVYSRNLSIPDEMDIDIANGEGAYTMKYRVAQRLNSFPSISDLAAYMTPTCYAVVKDEEALLELYQGQRLAYGDSASQMRWEAQIDLDADKETAIACGSAIETIAITDAGQWDMFRVEIKAQNAEDFYAMNGGFLFLGIFLGLIFIMATVLIIYYKQISEGYEDKSRFEIMQKVGLTHAQIKRSINTQILVIFFAPLIVAAIHVAFDFKMMIKLLSLFALTNWPLTLLCSVITLLAFAVVYGVVYALTAKTYYKIVS